MTYEINKNYMYRMPTHFGPLSGPRQGPDGRRFACRDNPKITALTVNFLTNSEQLEALLPERFELAGEPVVSISAAYITAIEWLAGRGYNVLGVKFPVTFVGGEDIVTGDLLTVLWENLADPILTGREELGVPKIYCELPEPTVLDGEWHIFASWLGFRFFDLTINNLRELSADEIANIARTQTSAGELYYKYIPGTGRWGERDVGYVTHVPGTAPNLVVKEQWIGDGAFEFHRARWEDMPTQYNIVNTLHELEVKEYRSATLSKTVGGKDLSDCRVLR